MFGGPNLAIIGAIWDLRSMQVAGFAVVNEVSTQN